jgi:hypothetical protein
VLADSVAEVYVAERGFGVFACTYHHVRLTRLGGVFGCAGGGSGLGCSGVRREGLAGAVVAYELQAGAGAGTGIPKEWLVIVRDLRTGKLVRRLPTGTPIGAEQVGGGETTAIVVKSDGAVAWIVEASRREYEVHAVDKSGSRVLARGRDLEPGSLALAGSTLYWTQGNKPFSSPLN